jgi:hypothetical protein
VSSEADAALAAQGAVLADAIEAALPVWAVRVVVELAGPVHAAAAERAGLGAASAIRPSLRALLGADVDEQRANPLAVVRTAVRWPATVLREAGVAPVRRDEHDIAHFPDDAYGLTPMAFADLGPDVQEAGILWGALKARAHLERHAGRPS